MLKKNLKIGDTVKIAKAPSTKEGTGWISPDMDNNIGKTGKVVEIEPDLTRAKVELGEWNNWYYPVECLELYDYQTEQDKWVELNRIKIGDKVRITAEAESFENGWRNTFNSDMQENVGKTGEVTGMSSDSGGIYVRIDKASFGYPFFVLEKVSSYIDFNGFRPYTEEEIAVLCKIIDRNGYVPELEKINKNLVRFESVGDFTTCVIIDHTGEMYVGASKRAKRDKPNQKVGEMLALKRAVLESGNAYS